MNHEGLAVVPGLLDEVGVADVADLGDDVELAEEVKAVGLGEGVELALVLAVEFAEVLEPVVEETRRVGGSGRADPAAVVMTADDDVLDAEGFDGELDDGLAVEVVGVDDVGDVAVDEDAAGLETDDVIGGDAAVSAADPEVFGVLLVGEFSEDAGVAGFHVSGPAAVVIYKVFKSRHGYLDLNELQVYIY